MDYDTKKTALRVLTLGAALFCIFPDGLGQIMNFRVIDSVPFLVPRVVFGVAAGLFAIGSWKKWW